MEGGSALFESKFTYSMRPSLVDHEGESLHTPVCISNSLKRHFLHHYQLSLDPLDLALSESGRVHINTVKYP